MLVEAAFQKGMALPPRGVEGSAVDGIGGGAFLWFFLVAVDKKEREEGVCHGFVAAHHDTVFLTPLPNPLPRGEGKLPFDKSPSHRHTIATSAVARARTAESPISSSCTTIFYGITIDEK